MQATVSQYVLKVHGRCNLACDHCYVYEHADQSWRAKPRGIAQPTAATAAWRIAQHAAAHDLPEVHVILHGGEPLLLGREAMRGVLSVLTTQIAPVTRLDLRIHSNGVLLDEQWCELFAEFGVMVGISLDGDRSANDRHRRYADGRSSHPEVLRALALLRRPRFRHLYAGILCTVDLGNDPAAVYRALIAERPPRLDFLLPHATWENPPYRPPGLPYPYADWLTWIYRRWTSDGRPVPIRLFDSIISAAAGGPSWTEWLGLDPVDLLVIETDGSWEQTDSMKTAFHGAAATGMGVHSHSVDEAARHPGVSARQRGLAALCVTCQRCPVVQICGGGLYSHRYRADTGFGNPSVYCPDLVALIGAIVADPVPARNPVPGWSRLSAKHPPSPRAAHELPDGAFDALAAGAGTLAAIDVMTQARLSMARALVAAVAAEDEWRDPGLKRAVDEGWAVLCALDASHPEIIAEIFAHPYTAAWAIRCLRPPAGADTELDRGHLAGLAAAAALKAGLTAELTLPARDGMLHLPTAGALATGTTERTRRIRVEAGRVIAADGGTWLPARRISEPVLHIAVEDLDPFRDCQDWPVTGRLSGPEWRAWRTALEASGRRLDRALPSYARVLTAGLRAVVPLRPSVAGMRSSTTRQAYGAVALALPADPSGVDELLIHEFQHVKLNVLLDIYELFDVKDTRRLRVPWREDPRPVEGVLHGIYAHLAVSHLWRARWHAGWGAREPSARERYLRYRSWVRGAAETLTATGALSARGDRFVAGVMRGTAGEQ